MLLNLLPYRLQSAPGPDKVIFRKEILPPQAAQKRAQPIAGLQRFVDISEEIEMIWISNLAIHVFTPSREVQAKAPERELAQAVPPSVPTDRSDVTQWVH
jgi:hypothetical protein